MSHHVYKYTKNEYPYPYPKYICFFFDFLSRICKNNAETPPSAPFLQISYSRNRIFHTHPHCPPLHHTPLSDPTPPTPPPRRTANNAMSTAGPRRGLSPPLKHGRSMSSDEVLRFLPVQSGLADPVVAAAAAGRTPQWVFPDASPSHTADYPAAASSPRVDPAVHVQRLIEALTRDKNALEQLHLEGQLENAQLRSQVQEIADAFKEALADNAPQECERCGHLWREIEAGRKEAARLRAELLDAATEAEAHKLRYDIFCRDAAAASDAAAARATQLEAEKAALDAAFAEERRRADARAAALKDAVARAEQEQERLRGQASGLAKEVEAGAAAEAARVRAAAAAGEAEDEARRRRSASLEEQLGSEEQRRRAAEAERDKLLAELKQQPQQPLPPAPWEAADSPRTSQKHHAEAVDMHRRLAALEVEVAHAKRASADLEAQRKELEEAKSTAEIELRSALIDKAGLTGELNALRELAAAKESGGDGGSADDSASLRKRLTAADAKLEAAVEDNARLEATLLSACQERDAIGGEVSTMRRQVTSLSAQMQAVEQARGTLAAEVDAAKAETARKQADGAHLEVELKVTQERLRNGVDTQERLTAKVASLKEKLRGHEAEKEELYRLREKLKYSEHEVGRVAAEKDEVVERHRAAVMEAEMQARRVEGLRLEMEALDSQHESMRTTHSDLETSLRANTEQRTTLEERVEDLQQQILKSKESEGSLNSSLSSLQGELEATQTKAEKKRRRLEERLRELEEELAAQRRHAEGAITALESDVLAGDPDHVGDGAAGGDTVAAGGGTLDARVRNLLARVRRERSAATAAVSDASGALVSLEEQLQSAQAKANQANLTALSLKEEVSSAGVRLEQRASEASRAQDEATALQATLSEVRARAQKEDAQSRERLEQLSGSLTLIQEELELERGQRSALQAREAALTAQVAALQGKLEGREAAGALNDELKADVERLQTQVAEEQQRSADAEAAKKDAAAAEAARGEAARAAEAATQKVDDLCLVRTALSHELMAEKKKAERAEAAQAEAQAARTVLEEACQAQKAQLTALAEDNTASRIMHSKEIAALKDTLRSANEAVATERGRTSAEAGMRLHTHAEMESELLLAKQQLDTSMKERAALQGRCDTLIDQLSSTREALGRLRYASTHFPLPFKTYRPLAGPTPHRLSRASRRASWTDSTATYVRLLLQELVLQCTLPRDL